MRNDAGTRTVTSIVVAEHWELPECPSVDTREVIAVVQTMKYHVAVKENEDAVLVLI